VSFKKPRNNLQGTGICDWGLPVLPVFSRRHLISTLPVILFLRI
jgi:hypothetical protein